ncbi:MAG: hypothetical protein NTW95_11920 [Candidatus Aminicenantes bacterium]|nr:hypothetical protein [Candidatus Aminicenantes bacterium]
MIKKHQKWIALLVTLTFMGLLQVSSMPCEAAAADRAEQISAANSEQGPRYIEEEGDSGFVGKKKSILPIVLIGVGVVAVAAVLFLVVLKSSYDITGEWTQQRTESGYSPVTRYLTFTGSKTSGTVRVDFDTWGGDDPDTGSYTVNDKAVDFIQYWAANPNNYEYHYEGSFTDKNTLSGTWHMNKPSGITDTGSWTATRSTTTAAVSQIASQVPQRDSIRRQPR